MRVEALTAQETGSLEQLLQNSVIYKVYCDDKVLLFKDYDEILTVEAKNKLTIKYFTHRIFMERWAKIPTTNGKHAYYRYHNGRLYVICDLGKFCFKTEEIV